MATRFGWMNTRAGRFVLVMMDNRGTTETMGGDSRSMDDTGQGNNNNMKWCVIFNYKMQEFASDSDLCQIFCSVTIFVKVRLKEGAVLATWALIRKCKLPSSIIKCRVMGEEWGIIWHKSEHFEKWNARSCRLFVSWNALPMFTLYNVTCK